MTDSDARQVRAARLRKLRQRFRAHLPARWAGIEAAWSGVRAGQAQALADLRRQVHSLVGSAGTFGLPQLGDQARGVEELLAGCSADQPLPSPQLDAIGVGLAELEHAFREQLQADDTQDAPVPDAPAIDHATPQRVLLIEDDTLLAREIVDHLQAFGWTVDAHPDLSGALAAIEAQAPAAIIVDPTLPEGAMAGFEFLGPARQVAPGVPFIAISSQWSWESRLAAARAGVEEYLVKPLDLGQLADRVDQLTRPSSEDPYRVLVLDDSPLLAEHYAQTLNASGMKAKAIDQPRQLLPSLDELQPELVLTDLHMPECNGIEVARIIRQDERYTGTPIVFLSTEAGRRQQLSAMRNGADDFITKPISDTDLVAAVGMRVKRFRALTSLIRQDSLTGLLNRIAFDLQAEVEIARAVRDQAPLVLVMVDIDHFKQVNDAHGHPAGDRVIKSLARLLRKRLRKYDLVGRYGGEEFTILMPGTTVDEAGAVMDQLREQFARLRLSTAAYELSCTFSAGLALLDPGASWTNLLGAADAALYQAKRRGRNQVCCTGGPRGATSAPSD